MILEIMACELFLVEKLIQNEIPEKETGAGNSKEHGENRSSTETSKSSEVLHLRDFLSTCFVSSTMENLIRSYSSIGYDLEVILQAKVSKSDISFALRYEI